MTCRIGRSTLLAALVFATTLLMTGVGADAQDEAQRPERWARRVELDGVENLYQVSESLYRSAQPTAVGMRRLKEHGVETIVNLRSFHSDRDEIGDTGLGYEHIYMKAWHPEEKELIRFLQIVSNPKRTPVLVHCQHGADRTGLMCAVYRMAIEGWSKEDAIQEMRDGGYGFNPIWANIVQYVQELDVDALKAKARLPANR